MDVDLCDGALAVNEKDAFLGPTKAARSPRKCTAVTGAPIATERTLSVMDAMEA